MMLGLGLSPSLNKARTVSIAEFFSSVAEANKLWLDFDRLDTQYQDITWTSVTAATQSIGLLLDRATWGAALYSAVLAASAELVVNGDFTSNTTGWNTVNCTIASTGGKLRATVSGSGYAAAYQTISSLVAGSLYRVSAEYQRIAGADAAQLRMYDTAVSSGSLGGLAQTSGGTLLTPASYVVAPDSNITFHLGQLNPGTGLAASGDIADFDNISVKRIPGNHARQTVLNSRPTLQSTGIRGDGGDDSMLTGMTPGTVMLFLVKAKFGATGAARALIGGTIGTTRCMLLRDASGKLAAGVGTDSESTIAGGADLAGKTGTAALYFDGSAVGLYWQEAGGAFTTIYSGPQHGAAGADPLRLLATNNGGVAANFSNDDVQRYRVMKGKAASLTQIAAMMGEMNAMPATL